MKGCWSRYCLFSEVLWHVYPRNSFHQSRSVMLSNIFQDDRSCYRLSEVLNTFIGCVCGPCHSHIRAPTNEQNKISYKIACCSFFFFPCQFHRISNRNDIVTVSNIKDCMVSDFTHGKLLISFPPFALLKTIKCAQTVISTCSTENECFPFMYFSVITLTGPTVKLFYSVTQF